MLKFLTIPLMAISVTAHAQSCNTALIDETTPATEFLDFNDGTVLHLKTGLLWAKCALGQTYSDGKCLHSATNFPTPSAALLAAADLKSAFLGHEGFRMPNIKELASIVERQCTAPTINLAVFPDTPSSTFLTNTFDINSPDEQTFRAIYFSNGEEFTPAVDTARNVRLVKNF